MSDHESPRPGGRSDDETFDRLRAADPVAGAEIDLSAVRRALGDRVDPGADDRVASPLRTTPAAHARWLRVAAVAAAVALVGSAAFVVGRQTATGPAAADTAISGAVVEGNGFVASSSAATGARQTAAGPGAETQASPDQKLIGGGYGRMHFTDGGLPTAGGSAQAWGFDPGAVLGAATAERIAAALGVTGSANVQYQTWMVGSTDGTGPSVSLSGDGVASVGYNDPLAYPNCAPDASVAGPATAGGVTESCVTEAPTTIDGDAAIVRATEVLSRIGIDPAGYTLTSPDDQAGGGFRSVTGTRLLDGQDTGLQFSFSFVGDRLASFYGGIAPVVSLGQYPVISAADAVNRMNDPRFGATSRSAPIDMMTTGSVGTQAAGPDLAVPDPPAHEVPTPSVPAPGATIAWPVTEVTLASAALGLSTQYQADGSTLLVPTWTLAAADGTTWSVIAVTDDRLDFAG